jgi:hypothetical protein
MSRGPGTMQRAILAALDDSEPDTWWGIYHAVTGSFVVQSENYRHSLRRALRALIAADRVVCVPESGTIGPGNGTLTWYRRT